jgi:hypothetical protein
MSDLLYAPPILVQGRIATLVGLATWVERLKDRGKLPIETIRAEETVLFEALPTDVNAILDNILPLFSVRASQDLRWSRWEMEFHDERTVVASDRDSYLARVLAVALRRCDVRRVKVDKLRFPYGLLYLLDGDDSLLVKTAEGVELEVAYWTHVSFYAPTDGHLMGLKELFAVIAEEYRRRFRESLVNAFIAESRLKDIAREASAALVSGSIARGALVSQKSWIQLSQPYERDESYFGINTVTDKEPFADLPDGMGHSGLGASYGHGLALAYDRWLISELKSRSAVFQTPLKGAFDHVIEVLKAEDLYRTPFSVLMVGGTRGLNSQLWHHPTFQGRYGDPDVHFATIPGYQGRLRVGDSHSVLIVQGVIEELRQSSVLLAGGGGLLVEEICPLPSSSMSGAVAAPPLLLWARAFSKDLALTTEFLKAPPPWLLEEKNTPPERYLETKVLLQLISRLRIVENGIGRAICFDWKRGE